MPIPGVSTAGSHSRTDRSIERVAEVLVALSEEVLDQIDKSKIPGFKDELQTKLAKEIDKVKILRQKGGQLFLSEHYACTEEISAEPLDIRILYICMLSRPGKFSSLNTLSRNHSYRMYNQCTASYRPLLQLFQCNRLAKLLLIVEMLSGKHARRPSNSLPENVFSINNNFKSLLLRRRGREGAVHCLSIRKRCLSTSPWTKKIKKHFCIIILHK